MADTIKINYAGFSYVDQHKLRIHLKSDTEDFSFEVSASVWDKLANRMEHERNFAAARLKDADDLAADLAEASKKEYRKPRYKKR